MNFDNIKPTISNTIPPYQTLEYTINKKAFGYSSALAEQIYQQIIAFDETINNDEEVGIKLVQYGEVIRFTISGIGYQDPYLIYFHGLLDDGSPIQLIQHVTQVSFVLIKTKRPEPEKPKRQIGFYSE